MPVIRRKPNLPYPPADILVYRNYLMPSGTRRVYVDATYEHDYRAMLMASPNPQLPHWSRDPTYNLRRKPAK